MRVGMIWKLLICEIIILVRVISILSRFRTLDKFGSYLILYLSQSLSSHIRSWSQMIQKRIRRTDQEWLDLL